MCHKFQEDSKAMRQRIAGHDLQSANNWFQRYKVLKPDFPCILCGIRDSHATNPGKDTSTMPGCYMWLESRGSQPTHDRRLVRRWNPTGPCYQRTKVDRISREWKDSKPPEPSLMCPYGFLGVKRCFGNNIYTKAFPKNTLIWRWPLLPFQVSQYTRMKEILLRVSSRIRDRRWLPSVSRMTRTHTTVIEHFSIYTHNKNEVTCAWILWVRSKRKRRGPV